MTDRNRDPARRSVAESIAMNDLTSYQVEYEEQCAENADHHHIKITALNQDLEDVTKDRPSQGECPECGAPIIHMSNQTVVE